MGKANVDLRSSAGFAIVELPAVAPVKVAEIGPLWIAVSAEADSSVGSVPASIGAFEAVPFAALDWVLKQDPWC
jgi:hypothetical protein